ncbi:MAG: hypothetical protein QM528_05790 [Phycisphaerales bacterium]|nr:hypothetical protein [Phycisphaerales bacterium]
MKKNIPPIKSIGKLLTRKELQSHHLKTIQGGKCQSAGCWFCINFDCGTEEAVDEAWGVNNNEEACIDSCVSGYGCSSGSDSGCS